MKKITINNWDFEVLNASTQRAQTFMYNYLRADKTDIYDAYKRPSLEKVRAFRAIENWSNNLENNTHVYVTGSNTMMFTCAVEGTHEDHRYLFYFTAYNQYAIAL